MIKLKQNKSLTLGEALQGIVLLQILITSIMLLAGIQGFTNWTIGILSAVAYLVISFLTLYVGRKIIVGVIPVSLLWAQLLTGSFTKPSIKSIILSILVFVASLVINSFLLNLGRRSEFNERVEMEKESRKIKELASIEDDEEYERKRKEYFDR